MVSLGDLVERVDLAANRTRRDRDDKGTRRGSAAPCGPIFTNDTKSMEALSRMLQPLVSGPCQSEPGFIPPPPPISVPAPTPAATYYVAEGFPIPSQLSRCGSMVDMETLPSLKSAGDDALRHASRGASSRAEKPPPRPRPSPTSPVSDSTGPPDPWTGRRAVTPQPLGRR